MDGTVNANLLSHLKITYHTLKNITEYLISKKLSE